MIKNTLKLFIKQAGAFDTITTKLLTLVLFTAIIPLFVIANISLKVINDNFITFNENNSGKNIYNYEIPLETHVTDKKGIIRISVISLFVAISFAIIFSRKITTPILNLVKAANIIASGNLKHRVCFSGNDEIAKLSDSFNEMAKNLNKQQQFRDNFIAALTHDLKVPLLAQNQTIKYLLKESYGSINNEQKEILELMKSTNNSSLEMVSTLLDIYKYDMNQMKLLRTDFNIVDLVMESINEIKPLAHEKKINISMTAGTNNLVINADSREIKRVLHNLINNAINNSYDEGRIICEITQVFDAETYSIQNYDNSTLKEPIVIENSVIIKIKDNGTGISEEDMPELFKRFSLSKGRKPSGTGIGLYYSQKVLERHNGKIWAESTEGKGSSFVFILPVHFTEET